MHTGPNRAQRAKAEAKVAEINAALAAGRQYRKGKPYELNKVVSEITDAGTDCNCTALYC